MGFWQLFLVNLKVIYRNRSGVFWTVLMPATIYSALTVLPLPNLGIPDYRYADYLLAGIIAMMIMQGGIYTLAYWMVDLRARGVIKRFQVTPLKKWHLILSLLCARTTVVLIQTALISLIGIAFFDASFAGNSLWVVLLAVLGAFIFFPLGLLISTFADTYDAAAPITAAIGLPLMFLGNIFYPVDSLPRALQAISQFLPITHLAEGLRSVYLTGDSGNMPYTVLILTIWAVGVILVTSWRFKFRE